MHQVCCRCEIQKSSERVIEEINTGIRKAEQEESLQVFFQAYEKCFIFEIHIHGENEDIIVYGKQLYLYRYLEQFG